MDEQDFAKAEIAKEKKQKLKKFKEKLLTRGVFLPSGKCWKKFEEFLEFRENEGGTTTPPSRSLVKSKITPPNPLVLKDFFLDQKKKKKLVKTTVCV